MDHSGLVASIESIAHTIVCLNPSRIRDSEVRQEATFAGINLLSLYHETIRAKHGHPEPLNHGVPPPPLTSWTSRPMRGSNDGVCRGAAGNANGGGAPRDGVDRLHRRLAAEVDPCRGGRSV